MKKLESLIEYSTKICNQDFSTYFKAAAHIINFLSTEDPSRLHYHVAREVLRGAGGVELEGEERARDLLARELVKECQEFAIQWNIFDKQELFSKEDRFYLDEIFSKHVATIGSLGKKLSKELLLASKEWYRTYCIDRKVPSLFKLWVDLDMQPYYCRYVKLLAEIIWEDRVKAQFYKNKRHIPALTQSIQRPVSRFLSSQAEIVMKNGYPTVVYEGKTIAEIAAIDLKLMPLVTRGTHNLSSIYHHKLLRYECKTGFENWAQGIADPRVMRYERGETELAEILGFKFKGAPLIIQSLLYAQSNMNFYFDDGSHGNLILLRKFRSRVTNRDEGIEIVLGTQLMPHYTFQTHRRGCLLVPVPDLPPFVSAPQYHAGQALLQMLVMEEFTNKSMDLAIEGSVPITKERWAAFLQQSGLPLSIFKKVVERWLVDGDDGSRFLIPTKEDRYILGEKYKKELQFLKAQGTIRRERKSQRQITDKKSNSGEGKKRRRYCRDS